MKKQHILIAAALLVVAATGFTQGQLSAPLDSEERYSSVESVEVTGLEYAVEVNGTSRSDVAVAVYTTEPQRIRIDTSGRRLSIEVRRAFLGFLRRPRPGRIVLTVPAGTELEIATASGAVAVTGVRESISLSTASGAVSVEDTRGALSIGTASGAIAIQAAEGPKQIRTASGAVQVRRSAGDVQVRTSSGAMQLADIQGDIALRSASGRIGIERTEGALSVNTSSGAIQGQDVTLTGNSNIESTSGRVRFDANLEDLRVAARSVSGSVSVGSAEGKNVEFGDGTIDLTVRTVSGGVDVR